MRNCLVWLFVSVFFATAYSQEVINEHELPDKGSFQNIELLSIGDTIIANLSMWFQGNAQLSSFVLSPDRKLASLPNLRWANRKDIAGIVALPDGRKRIYYVNQEKKQFTILASELHFKNRNFADTPGELILGGQMLGMFTDNNTVVLFYFDKGTIHEIVLDGLNITNKKSYVLPAGMADVHAREITFFPEGDHVGAVQAKSTLKLILNDESITAVHDYWGYGYKSVYTTVAICERSSGKVTVKTFPSDGILSSTIVDNFLYRTINSKNTFVMEVFDVNSATKIHEHRIDASPATEKQMVYFREGRAHRVSKTESLEHMMHIMKRAAPVEPFVMAQNQGDSVVITWGNYFDDNGAMGPGGLDPVTGLIIMAVGTTIKQVSPGPGISRYFYLMGNVKGGFTLKDDPDFLRARIDLFEMEQQKSEVAKKYGYFNFRGDVIGIYYLPKKNKLKFVKFQS